MGPETEEEGATASATARRASWKALRTPSSRSGAMSALSVTSKSGGPPGTRPVIRVDHTLPLSEDAESCWTVWRDDDVHS